MKITIKELKSTRGLWTAAERMTVEEDSGGKNSEKVREFLKIGKTVNLYLGGVALRDISGWVVRGEVPEIVRDVFEQIQVVQRRFDEAERARIAERREAEFRAAVRRLGRAVEGSADPVVRDLARIGLGIARAYQGRGI